MKDSRGVVIITAVFFVWKVSIFWVSLVHIFPHSDQKSLEYEHFLHSVSYRPICMKTVSTILVPQTILLHFCNLSQKLGCQFLRAGTFWYKHMLTEVITKFLLKLETFHNPFVNCQWTNRKQFCRCGYIVNRKKPSQIYPMSHNMKHFASVYWLNFLGKYIDFINRSCSKNIAI